MFVIEEELVTGLPNVTVVLVNPENPGNVGFATRAMANFGVSKLRIVGSDPRQDQLAQIFSVHASEMLDAAEVFDNLESALEDMEASWGATARSGSNHSVTRALVPLPELPNPASREGEVALVFGRESIGLTNEEIALCDLAFGIPTDQSYESMNLSHAIAVVLYELYVRYGIKPERRPTDARAANREERAQVCVFYNEIVDETTIKDFRKPIAKQVFRNLVGRSYMTGRELATLTGTIRKFKQLIDRNSEKD
ncbi:MAG: RNA methyltransferase [Candidatus Thorarchaeota archaeon]